MDPFPGSVSWICAWVHYQYLTQQSLPQLHTGVFNIKASLRKEVQGSLTRNKNCSNMEKGLQYLLAAPMLLGHLPSPRMLTSLQSVIPLFWVRGASLSAVVLPLTVILSPVVQVPAVR